MPAVDPRGRVVPCSRQVAPTVGLAVAALEHRRGLVWFLLFAAALSSSGPARAAPPTKEGPPSGSGQGRQIDRGVGELEPPAAEAPGAEVDVGGPRDELDAFEPPPSDAPAAARARAWFLRGAELFGRRHFLAAGEAYDASFAAAPAPSTRYNAAYSYDLGGAPLRAIEAYEDFLALLAATSPEGDGPAELDAILEEGARKASLRIEALEGQLARIDLQLAGEDAGERIAVDGEPRAREAFPLRVLPGAHRVEVTRADGSRVVETFEALPGERVRLRIAAPTPPAGPGAEVSVGSGPPGPGGGEGGVPGSALGEASDRPQVDVDRRRSAKRLRTAGWAVTGAAGASAVAAGVLGGLTLGAKRDFEDNLCGEGCVYDPSLEPRFERRKDATNVMVGVSAGLGVLGVALIVAGHLRGRSSTSTGLDGAFGPRWVVKHDGLTLHF